MAHRILIADGPITDGAHWQGGIGPNPAGGDTFETNGFNLTSCAGIFGDDVTNFAGHINGGSVTLTGQVEGHAVSEVFYFEDGTLHQGAHDIINSPTFANSGCAVANFSQTFGHTNTWNSFGGDRISRNVRGSTHSILFANPSTSLATLNINWTNGGRTEGHGNGVTNPALAAFFLNSNDSWTYQGGGRIINCGQLDIRLGLNQTAVFDWDDIFIGFFNGTGYTANRDQLPFNIREGHSNPTTVPRLTNALFYDADAANDMTLDLTHVGGPIDVTNLRTVNFDDTLGSNDLIAAQNMMVIGTSTTNDCSIGAGANATPNSGVPNIDNIAIIQGAPAGVHAPTFSGDSANYTVNNMVIDAMGLVSLSEVGDQPICNMPVTINNLVTIHGAGGVNTSLNINGSVNINGWTIHAAVGIIMGESPGNSSATELGNINNVIISQPYKPNLVNDYGGAAVNQTAHNVDYIAYRVADMDAGNEVHPVLGGAGYVAAGIADHIDNYGANDRLYTDAQFADPTRHALTWCATFAGFAATLSDLGRLMLASVGLDNAGAEIAPVAGVSSTEYWAYIQGGYTSSNPDFAGTGLAGADFGAFPVAAPITVGGSLQAQDATVSGTTVNDPVSVAVVAAAADLTVGGNVQAQDATVSASVNVLQPFTFKYTTTAKLFNAFGKTEMALLAAPENANITGDLLSAALNRDDLSAWSLQDIADANAAIDRLISAVASAERLIDSYISPRYTLPLSITLIGESALPEYCNHIVRYKLMDDRTTDEVDKRYNEAMRWLRDISMNKASLGVQDTAVATPQGRMVSRTGTSKYSWDDY
jgi:phage gp36-like protein